MPEQPDLFNDAFSLQNKPSEKTLSETRAQGQVCNIIAPVRKIPGIPKKQNLSVLKKYLWSNYFSPYIRLRDAIATTGGSEYAKCCTCDKPYPAFGKGCLQAGHFVPGRHNSYLFDPICVHAQCYHCNVGLNGNFVMYEDFMLRKYGQEEIDRLKYLYRRKPITKFTPGQLLEMVEEYKNKYNGLLT